MPQVKFPIPERDTDLEGLKGIVAQYSKTLSWLLAHLDWNNVNLVASNGENPFDGFGINPFFIRCYPNKCWNSGFEGFNVTTLKPDYWSAGIVSADATFNGTYSLKLTNTQVCQQEQVSSVGMADPAWWAEFTPYTRVAFKAKGGPVTVSVHKLSDDSALTLTDASGNTGTSITYASASDWVVGHRTFQVNTSGTPGKVYVKFTAGGTVYIDDVDIAPDFTGKWPMLYQDGPKSISAGQMVSLGIMEYGVAEFNSAGVEFVLENGYVGMPIPSVSIIGGNNLLPVVTILQESISSTLCYSKVSVVPETGSTGTHITMSAVCVGTVVEKP